MICANCNSTVDTAFCSACGQKSEVHRITATHLAHEGFHSVTHADKGFLLLVKELISRPGFIAKEFIEGRRKRYFNPLSFLVISSALLAYLGSITGYMDKLTGASGGRAGGRISAEWQEVFQIAANSGKWLTLLFMAPLFALLSWVFFLRKKYNYAEHFVLHAFIFGEAAILRMVVFIPLFLIVPQYTTVLNMVAYELIYLIFLTVAYKQFFQQHLALTIVKVVLIRVLFVVLFWVMIYSYVVTKNLLT
jgi:hypothetical protein